MTSGLSETTPSQAGPVAHTIDRILAADRVGWLSALQGLAVILGAVLRIARYAHFRCLWLDEIYLADSVLFRGCHNLLFAPLANQQAAPPGFLLLSRLLVSVIGPTEHALRLLPLLAGLVSLPLFLALARRTLHPGGATLAIALLAMLEPMIYYSSDFKQYSCDMAVSLGIMLSMLRFLDLPDARRAWVVGVVGVWGLVLSFPAIFVLSGAGMVAVWHFAPRRKVIVLRRLALVGAIWLISFVTQYAVFVRPNLPGQTRANLVYYWNNLDAFAPWSLWRLLPWLLTKLWHLCQESDALSFVFPDVAFLALLVGLFIAARARRIEFALLLAPLPLLLAASMLKQYPFDGRLALFICPSLLIFIVLGIEGLFRGRSGKIAALAISAMLIWPATTEALDRLKRPPGREESLQTYQWVARHWHSGDTLYLSHFAPESYSIYFQRAGWPDDPAANGHLWVQPEFDADSRGIIDDVRTFAGRKRVWVVFIHARGGTLDREEFTLAAFNDIGTLRPGLSHVEDGADACFFDCSVPPPPPHGR
jgi:hypothetical protein